MSDDEHEDILPVTETVKCTLVVAGSSYAKALTHLGLLMEFLPRTPCPEIIMHRPANECYVVNLGWRSAAGQPAEKDD